MLKKQYAEIELLRLIYRGLVFQIDSQIIRQNGQSQRIDTIGIIRDDGKVALYTKQSKEGKRPMYYATGNLLNLEEAETRASAYKERQFNRVLQQSFFKQSVFDNVLAKLSQA